jgi:hypothetical protein
VPTRRARAPRPAVEYLPPSEIRRASCEQSGDGCTTPTTARYQHTKRRLGRQRGPKVARIELSRKLTETIWQMLTRNQPFAPAGAGFV